jgi:deoxyribodipyrimidine photo-lyase
VASFEQFSQICFVIRLVYFGMTTETFPSDFIPTRAAGLNNLAAFIPEAGRAYAVRRNTDYGPQERSNVSMLSPYIRHRLITEREVLDAVLTHHSQSAAEKFIQEVFWRSYFKGYLESRPQVWRNYVTARDQQIQMIQAGKAIGINYQKAVTGKTGIDCFDAWVEELIETGYLHNHARMWFASIWIFTLKLPWELGADFTFRHFKDGDPASNTLSWRWVAGLHTKGKTYLARADNIKEYTNGRFNPKGLAREAVSLEESLSAPQQAFPKLPTKAPSGPALLLLTEEDLHPESLGLGEADLRGILCLRASRDRSSLPTSEGALAFVDEAIKDCLARAKQNFNVPADMIETVSKDTLIDHARNAGVTRILTAYTPVGPLNDIFVPLQAQLEKAGIALSFIARAEDQEIWSYTTKGFFGLKERIPELIGTLGLGPKDLLSGLSIKN